MPALGGRAGSPGRLPETWPACGCVNATLPCARKGPHFLSWSFTCPFPGVKGAVPPGENGRVLSLPSPSAAGWALGPREPGWSHGDCGDLWVPGISLHDRSGCGRPSDGVTQGDPHQAAGPRIRKDPAGRDQPGTGQQQQRSGQRLPAPLLCCLSASRWPGGLSQVSLSLLERHPLPLCPGSQGPELGRGANNCK